jgi:hypothetical protein
MGTNGWVVEAKPLHHSWTKVLHQDIALCDHLENGLPCSGVFKVENDTPLIAIEINEPRSYPSFKGDVEVAHDVATGRLKLNNVGPQVTHEHGAERTSNGTAEIEHADTGKRSPHKFPSFLCP